MNLLSDQGLRLDGRRPSELRKIRCKLGVFSQTDGSAYLEQGNTKVLAAVYGPHQVRGTRVKAQHNCAIINCQFSMATFSTFERKRRPRGDNKSSEMTLQIKQALQASIRTEVYPKSQIDVYVEVLQADGGNLSACINASTLALIDAGIPLKEYVISCTASLGNGETPLVDISHLEETMGGSNLTVAALPLSKEVVISDLSNRFHVDQLQAVFDEALTGCQNIYNILDAVVKMHLQKTTGGGAL